MTLTTKGTRTARQSGRALIKHMDGLLLVVKELDTLLADAWHEPVAPR